MATFGLVGRLIAPICGLAAAIVAWRAAFLWRKASAVEIPSFDPPRASIGDAPELHILNTMVQLNKTADAMRLAGQLNQASARWTALAAVLSGTAALLGTF